MNKPEKVTKKKALYHLDNLLDDCALATSNDPWDFDDEGNWDAMWQALLVVRKYVENSRTR